MINEKKQNLHSECSDFALLCCPLFSNDKSHLKRVDLLASLSKGDLNWSPFSGTFHTEIPKPSQGLSIYLHSVAQLGRRSTELQSCPNIYVHISRPGHLVKMQSNWLVLECGGLSCWVSTKLSDDTDAIPSKTLRSKARGHLHGCLIATWGLQTECLGSSKIYTLKSHPQGDGIWRWAPLEIIRSREWSSCEWD